MPLPEPSAAACDPYRSDRRLFCYVARGVEHLPLGGKVSVPGVELFAADDASALAYARAALRMPDAEVERLPLPAIEPPGLSDDAQRESFGAARTAYYDESNGKFRAERASAGRTA